MDDGVWVWPARKAGKLGLGGCDGATGFLDLLTGASAQVGDFDGQLFADFTGAEDLDGVTVAIDETDFTQGAFIHHSAVVEGFVEVTDIDDFEDVFELGIAEAFLGQTAEKGHLTAFEARADAAASACKLTFVAFTGGFAMAGAFSTADALAALACSRAGLSIVQSHDEKFRVEVTEGV
jgi:hypothetical protein